MNLLHLKYALEVEKTRSINKAAENLFIGQPTLSKSIKKLEESLGLTLFIRTPSGIMPTTDGERFLARAHNIMAQANELEAEYSSRSRSASTYSFTLPRCPLTLEALAKFSYPDKSDIKLDLGGPERAAHNILQNNFDIAIVRYYPKLQPLLPERFEQEGLKMKVLHKGNLHLTYTGDCPPQPDCDKSIQIVLGSSPLPFDSNSRHIFTRDIGGLISLLEADNSYTYLPPLPDRYNLRQHPTAGEEYADIVLYKRGRTLNKIDNSLIATYLSVTETIKS